LQEQELAQPESIPSPEVEIPSAEAAYPTFSSEPFTRPPSERRLSSEEAFKKLPAIEPMMGEPINSRAKALLKLGLSHWHQGDYEAAARFLNTVINLAAVFCDHRFEALCYNAIALVETDLGKFEEAIRAYETAASLAPLHFSPWKEIGYLYSQSNKYEEGHRTQPQ
jgi:tetratricopeptide (TPR) repeat protein